MKERRKCTRRAATYGAYAVALALSAVSIAAHAQIGPTAQQCQVGNCSGYGPPVGRVGLNATFVYSDVSVAPVVQYRADNGGWTPLPALGSGIGTATTDASQLVTGTLAVARLPTVPNSALANSSLIVNGAAVPLGSAVNTPRLATLTGAAASGVLADYFLLDGSGTTTKDSSGNGYDGTFFGSPSWTTGGLIFDGTNGVSLPAALNATRTIVLQAYVNPCSVTTCPVGYGTLVSSSLGSSGINILTTAAGINETNFQLSNWNNSTITYSADSAAGEHTIVFTFGSSATSTVDHIYIDGNEVSYPVQGTLGNAQTSGNLFLGTSGQGPWVGNGAPMTMHRARFYSTALSATDVKAITSVFRSDMATRGVPLTPDPINHAYPLYVAVGDSITFGQGLSSTQAYPALLSIANGPAFSLINMGISGLTANLFSASDFNRVAPYCRNNQSAPTLVTVFAGTNDLPGLNGTSAQAAATLFNFLSKEVSYLHNAGCRVGIGTMISRAGSTTNGRTFDQDKNALNTIIRAQWKAAGADFLMDTASTPLGQDGAYANTTYFQGDQTHPTATGQVQLALALNGPVNYLFGSSEAAPHIVTSATYSMVPADGYLQLAPTASGQTLTLPSCVGLTGLRYAVANTQNTFGAISVKALSAAELINGMNYATTGALVLGNTVASFTAIANPPANGGCSWSQQNGQGLATSVRTGSASNTDTNGSLVMTSGTASYTFTGTYASAPACIATDTSAISAVRIQVSTTALTITGTSGDSANYICIGKN